MSSPTGDIDEKEEAATVNWNQLLRSKGFWAVVIVVFVLASLIAGPSSNTDQQASPSSTETTSATETPSETPTETPTPTVTAEAGDGAASSSSDTTAGSGDQQDAGAGASSGDADLATAVLDTLPVKGRAAQTGYSRDQFGQAWSDVDHNGCDTRNDILKRDMTNVTFKSGTHDCIVLTGTLADPYTGKTIQFQRGQGTSTAVQVDHVVALSDAWQTGAQQLSSDQRLQLANDPYNLLAVDGPANEQKSDSDAASWLPSNTAFRCEYVARQIGVKQKYSLWVTSGEKTAMQNVLSTCPSQTVPTAGGVSSAATASAASSEQNALTKSNSASAASGSSQSATGSEDNVYYNNCSEVRAAGKAPLNAGQPGYRAGLDRDNDGVACETS